MTRWDKFRSICNDKEMVSHFISNMAYDNEPTAQDVLEFFNSEHNGVLDAEFKRYNEDTGGYEEWFDSVVRPM